MKTDVIIVSGPTGGHFSPALALYEQIQAKCGNSVEFAIVKRPALCKTLINKHISFRIIGAAKFSRKAIFEFPFRFLYAIGSSVKVILRDSPKIVIGTGSYVCVPFVICSKLLGRKVLLHEQNYIPGAATKLLSRFADAIFLTFPNKSGLPAKKCFITGMPVRREFQGGFSRKTVLTNFGLSNDRQTILVMGGSQSSHYVNRLMVENVRNFQGKNFQFIHLAGSEKEFVQIAYRKHSVKAVVFDYFENMGQIYSAVDAAITRAGAGTVTELVLNKIPAILIPYPFASAHQDYNAMFLKNRNACFIFRQTEKDIDCFPDIFEKFRNHINEIRKNLGNIDLVDTEEKMCRHVCSLLTNYSGTISAGGGL